MLQSYQLKISQKVSTGLMPVSLTQSKIKEAVVHVGLSLPSLQLKVLKPNNPNNSRDSPNNNLLTVTKKKIRDVTVVS
jgi:hypothetical protein